MLIMDYVYYVDLVHNIITGRNGDEIFKMKPITEPLFPAGKYNLSTCKTNTIVRSNYDLGLGKILQFACCKDTELLKITLSGFELAIECF